MMAWLLLLLPSLRMAKFLVVAAIALALVTVLYLLLDARAATERARAELALAHRDQVATFNAFLRYRQFTEAGVAATRRALEAKASTQRRFQPLRDTSHASPTDDGPLPRISVRFLIGLRLLQAGIIAAPGPDPTGPGGPSELLRPAPGPATRQRTNPRLGPQ